MRIISGKFRRKSIFPPKNFRARPTTDVAKESLFNIIENNFDIESVKVLDLFGGTGSISFEFASRECPQITCVELNFHHFNFIKNTAKELKIEHQLSVIKTNAFTFLNYVTEAYDIIFADPPYDLKELPLIPDLIFAKHILLPDGVFILEHSKNYNFSNHKHFKYLKTYGSVNFSFFGNSDE
ncbi:MAG: RsmD family RNA methyltransferase [Salinivirgaceae bacterium]